MISRRFPIFLVLGVLFWSAVVLGAVCVVDPYSISPVQVALPGVNDVRPRSVNIDRQVKPFMVWSQQPRTVFLGTSRIHQSIDPAELDGTEFVPAYNASIPASSLGMNIAHLTWYIRLDPNLRTVFVEIFMWNFVGQGQDRTEWTFGDFIRNFVALFFSINAVEDTVATIEHNTIRGGAPAYELRRGGFFHYPPGHDASGPFSAFPGGMLDIHRRATAAAGHLVLNDAAFRSIQELIDLAHAAGLDIVFILTPQHAYELLYIDSAGEWHLFEEWLQRLTAMTTVISFSQPNEVVYEPVTSHMTYWNDPFHFSLRMGRLIQAGLADRPLPEAPANFMRRLTPADVAAHVAAVRAAIRDWRAENRDFVDRFEAAPPGGWQSQPSQEHALGTATHLAVP